MKPIKVNDDLKQFAILFSEKLFDDCRSDFKQPISNLISLLKEYSNKDYPDQRTIIKWIIKGLKNDLLYIEPEKQQDLINTFEKSKYKDVFSTVKDKKKFSDVIISALRYDAFRNRYASKIANKLSLKTCPYCNAMLAITVKGKKARFQLDHFYPKSKYPFLSISFFNLIPCCANCNQAKSDSSVKLGDDFHLYANHTPENAFLFKLNDVDVIKKTIGIKSSDLSVAFTHKYPKHKTFVINHNKSFDIQGIYDTQKDIVEELVWKSQVYCNSQIQEYKDLLKLSESEIKRMVVGNYINKEDIHKRPMSKFMQDIAKQLKLID